MQPNGRNVSTRAPSECEFPTGVTNADVLNWTREFRMLPLRRVALTVDSACTRACILHGIRNSLRLKA